MFKCRYIILAVIIILFSSCLIISPGSGDISGIKGYMGDMPQSDPVFRDIDNHALNAPGSAEGSLESLVLYLIEPAKNDLEKVRSIYRWITANVEYDVEGLLQNRPGDNSAQGVLENRTSVCEGYSNLFLQLAEIAGLETVKISGFAKGYGYTAGDSITGGSNHAWNAVKIDSTWELIDSTWGAGYMNQNYKFVRRFSEYYFLPEPEDFIYDHLPVEQDWQLLNNPISKVEYEQRPHILPMFLYCGITIEGTGKTISGNMYNQTFRTKYDIALMGKLMQNGSELKTDIEFSAGDNGYFDVNAMLPGQGEYILMLFVKEGSGIAGEYEWAASIKINN